MENIPSETATMFHGLARQQQEVHASANLPTDQNASVSQAAISTDKHGSLFMVMAKKGLGVKRLQQYASNSFACSLPFAVWGILKSKVLLYKPEEA